MSCSSAHKECFGCSLSAGASKAATAAKSASSQTPRSKPAPTTLLGRAVQLASTATVDTKKVAVVTPQALSVNLLTALELEEMANRSKDGKVIPEFHAGSVLRVTYVRSVSQQDHPVNFVGICISKTNRKLGSGFILRNVIDGVPVEVALHSYNPLVKKIEVLRLCRRRRAKLYYLRNRPNKESSFPFNMAATPRTTAKIPIEKAA